MKTNVETDSVMLAVIDDLTEMVSDTNNAPTTLHEPNYIHRVSETELPSDQCDRIFAMASNALVLLEDYNAQQLTVIVAQLLIHGGDSLSSVENIDNDVEYGRALKCYECALAIETILYCWRHVSIIQYNNFVKTVLRIISRCKASSDGAITASVQDASASLFPELNGAEACIRRAPDKSKEYAAIIMMKPIEIAICKALYRDGLFNKGKTLTTNELYDMINFNFGMSNVNFTLIMRKMAEYKFIRVDANTRPKAYAFDVDEFNKYTILLSDNRSVTVSFADILNLIRKRSMSAEDLRIRLHVSGSSIFKKLSELVELGYVSNNVRGQYIAVQELRLED